MRPVSPGTKGTFRLRVEPEHLASRFKDPVLPNVLATPVMILVMENAALDAIRSHLDPGESVVGVGIEVQHIAATPVGHDVFGEAEVTNVDGRRIDFRVRARDETEIIGEGTHRRMVVDLQRLNERLARKSRS
jgi:fluoroacetyl-CoA thioesterase